MQSVCMLHMRNKSDLVVLQTSHEHELFARQLNWEHTYIHLPILLWNMWFISCWARSKFAYASLAGIWKSLLFVWLFFCYVSRKLFFGRDCWWGSRFHQQSIIENHRNRPCGLQVPNCHYHTRLDFSPILNQLFE